MNEPQINVDHFYHRPTYRVVGVLTEQSQIPAISSELQSAGVDVAAVEILCGEQGAHILDDHGRYHRLRGRIVRAFQRHQVHDVGSFGPGTFGQFPIPDAG